MSRPPISITDLSSTITISECHDGFWLWDETREMNLSMRAKTRDAAISEAFDYYQKRLKVLEAKLNDITTKLDAFLAQFSDPDDEFDD